MKQRNQPQKSHSIFGTIKNGTKTGPYQHANCGGDEPVGDDHNRDGLGCGEQDGHDDVNGGSENISPTGRVHAGFEVGNLRDHRLELGLIDLVDRNCASLVTRLWKLTPTPGMGVL
jgi:hypothetical protein